LHDIRPRILTSDRGFGGSIARIGGTIFGLFGSSGLITAGKLLIIHDASP
jgi:hypothetical protein